MNVGEDVAMCGIAGFLYHEVRRGKSIGRILANSVLKQWTKDVKGIVLDLACGQSPSYWRIMRLKENPSINLVGVDYNPTFRPSVVADLTKSIPFRDTCADTIIISSFLYITPDPQGLLKEARRVLKKGGLLLLTAPLVFPHNPEPADYWRFTEEGLRLLLEQVGFTDIVIIPTGGRWTAASYLLAPFLRPYRLVSPLIYWICLKLDVWTERRFKRLPRCPIGYVVKARSSA